MPEPRTSIPVEQLASALPALHARFHEFDASAALEVGLSEAQRQLLECLDSHGALTNGRLCTLLGRAQSSVSELVERLFQRGWVTRLPEPDRRKSSYAITLAGQEALRKYQSLQRQALRERLSCLDAEAQHSLLRTLGLLLDALELHQPEKGSKAALN